MALTREIKVRVSDEMKADLARVTEERGDGEKIADVVRDAIRDFLKKHPPKRPK